MKYLFQLHRTADLVHLLLHFCHAVEVVAT